MAVEELHVHVHVPGVDALRDKIDELKEFLMANMSDLMAKVAELQAGQTETLKDVRRLIEQGNTDAAIAQVQDLIDKNTQLDAEVEAASPEPAPPAPPVEEPAPPTEGTPGV